MVQVELSPFNDIVLNRNLAIVCERVNQVSPCLPDGRPLVYHTFDLLHSCCAADAQNAVSPCLCKSWLLFIRFALRQGALVRVL